MRLVGVTSWTMSYSVEEDFFQLDMDHTIYGKLSVVLKRSKL
jgi:hypothetical protein